MTALGLLHAAPFESVLVQCSLPTYKRKAVGRLTQTVGLGMLSAAALAYT